MSNFLNTLAKLFGFLDTGLVSLIYSIYLRVTKKLPYEEERLIKPENKELLIKTRSLCFFLYFVIITSLLINLNFTSFNRTYVWIIHVILIVCVFVYRVIKEGKYYR